MKIKIVPGSTICGICEQPGGTKLWHNQQSSLAHPVCIRWIQRIDDNLRETIGKYFPTTTPYRNKAHANALTEVKKQIGDASILTFLKTNGSEELSNIFLSEEVRNAIKIFTKATQTQYYPLKWSSTKGEFYFNGRHPHDNI